MRLKRAFALPVLAGILLASVPAGAATRPDSLSGASRAQFDRLQRDRNGIAVELRLSRNTVDAIAVVVGQGGGLSDVQIVTAIRAQASRAQQLLVENRTLRSRIASLEDATLRDPALAALDRAKLAIDEGRFADAETDYAAVRKVRWDQVHDGLQAWKAAVDGQAVSAILAGENDRAEELRLAAGREMRVRMEAEGRQAEWEQITAAAEERLNYGHMFGSATALARAVALFRDEAAPLYPEPSRNWAATQDRLGATLMLQGQRSAGEEGLVLLDRAAEAHRNALRVRTEAANPVEWANSQFTLGRVREAQGLAADGRRGIPSLRQAADAYGGALRVYRESGLTDYQAQAQDHLDRVTAFLRERGGK